MINIIHSTNNEGGAFLVMEGEENKGEMCYALQGDTMTIVHTQVDASLKGQHVGHQLVDKGIAYARERNYSIVPVCSFTRAVFERNASAVADVWKR